MDEKSSLKDLLGNSSNANVLKVEAEVIFKIGVEVYGKGKDYSGIYEFKPHELIDSLRYKVPFFKTFASRGYDLIVKHSDHVVTDFRKDFQECGLKNGSQLILREQGKVLRELQR